MYNVIIHVRLLSFLMAVCLRVPNAELRTIFHENPAAKFDSDISNGADDRRKYYSRIY